jgi:hypothetical protein
MWVLIFYIALVYGGPETAYKIPTDFPMKTFAECKALRHEVWSNMNKAYPPEEQKLYRFVCKHQHD